jgi:hypothetical protein
MANLFSIDGGRLMAFYGLLDRLGITEEEALECLRDPQGAGARRVAAFKDPGINQFVMPSPIPLHFGCTKVRFFV